ncbi:hypothetical protein MRX96_038134 [Rhipicephalus microplus]
MSWRPHRRSRPPLFQESKPRRGHLGNFDGTQDEDPTWRALLADNPRASFFQVKTACGLDSRVGGAKEGQRVPLPHGCVTGVPPGSAKGAETLSFAEQGPAVAAPTAISTGLCALSASGVSSCASGNAVFSRGSPKRCPE